MNANFDRHYRVLNVQPGCTWEEIRKNYRRLVRAWHPDYRPAGARTDTDDRIKEITSAYRSLADYRRRHGVLPGVVSDDVETRLPNPSPLYEAAPVKPWDTATGAYRRSTKKGGRLAQHGLLIGAVVVMAYLSVVYLGDDTSIPDAGLALPSPLPPRPHDEIAQVGASPRTIGIGLHARDVFRLQGSPTHVTHDTWYYGESVVHFTDDRVVAWDIHPSFPLAVDAYPSAYLPPNASFTIGSSKRHVLSVQGVPLSERADIWDYSGLRVHFRNDRVIAWEVLR